MSAEAAPSGTGEDLPWHDVIHLLRSQIEAKDVEIKELLKLLHTQLEAKDAQIAALTAELENWKRIAEAEKAQTAELRERMKAARSAERVKRRLERQGSLQAHSYSMDSMNMLHEEQRELYRAKFDFKATQEHELSLRAGDTVTVLNIRNPDWWLAELNAQKGFVPSSYLERLSNTSPAPPPVQSLALAPPASATTAASIGSQSVAPQRRTTLTSAPLSLSGVLNACVNRLGELNAISTEGIFRIAGRHTLMASLVKNLLAGTPNFENADVHDVASALKQFLRDTPKPLIPFEFYSAFIAAQNSQELTRRLRSMKDFIQNHFPQEYREALKILITFLAAIARNSHITKMDSGNLGIVFGPTIMRDPAQSALSEAGKAGQTNEALLTAYAEQMQNLKTQNEVVRTLIDHAKFLFEAPPLPQRKGSRILTAADAANPIGVSTPVGSAARSGKPAIPPRLFQARAVANYAPQPNETDQLALSEGDVIAILNVDDASWWLAEMGGVVGWVPASHVAPIGAEKIRSSSDSPTPANNSNAELTVSTTATSDTQAAATAEQSQPLSTPTLPVDRIVACLSKLYELSATSTPGILRTSGNASSVNQLVEGFAADAASELFGSVKEVHDLAGALKCYLARLPMALVPPEVSDALIALVRRGVYPETVGEISRVLSERLDAERYTALAHILHFCWSISQNSATTRMGVNNVAAVMAPVILRPSAVSPSPPQSPRPVGGVSVLPPLAGPPSEAQLAVDVTKLLIEHSGELFAHLWATADGRENEQPEVSSLIAAGSVAEEETIAYDESAGDEQGGAEGTMGVDASEQQQPMCEPNNGGSFLAVALHDYNAEQEGDLSFRQGDIINIYQWDDDTWWQGELNGVCGSVPASYVEALSGHTEDDESIAGGEVEDEGMPPPPGGS